MREPDKKLQNKSINRIMLSLLLGLLVILFGPFTAPGNAIQLGLGDLLNACIGLLLLFGLPLIVVRQIKSRAQGDRMG